MLISHCETVRNGISLSGWSDGNNIKNMRISHCETMRNSCSFSFPLFSSTYCLLYIFSCFLSLYFFVFFLSFLSSFFSLFCFLFLCFFLFFPFFLIFFQIPNPLTKSTVMFKKSNRLKRWVFLTSQDRLVLFKKSNYNRDYAFEREMISFRIVSQWEMRIFLMLFPSLHPPRLIPFRTVSQCEISMVMKPFPLTVDEVLKLLIT